MTATRPFTRQSTILELATTLPGRGFKSIIVRQLPPVDTEKERQELEDFTVSQSLETLVELSEGKLTWDVADAVVDLANKKPHRIVSRAVGANPAKALGALAGVAVVVGLVKKIVGKNRR